MKVLLFFRSGAWHSLGRLKKCFETVGVGFFCAFLILTFAAVMCFNETDMWFVFSIIPLFALVFVYFLVKPDWYVKIKDIKGHTVYFAVFGTRYLYSAGKWLDGRFVRFSFNEGFEVFDTSEVMHAGDEVLVRNVDKGYIVYRCDKADKVFIGRSFEGQYGLYDNGKQISVVMSEGVLMLDYAGEKYLHLLLKLAVGSKAVYRDVVSGEVYSAEEFVAKRVALDIISCDYLALETANGEFVVYALCHRGWRYGLVCEIGGVKEMRRLMDGGKYVLTSSNRYRWEK